MTAKEKFINCIQKEIFDQSVYAENYDEDWEDICNYWHSFLAKQDDNGITDIGKNILTFMQENEVTSNNLFKARQIGEGLFMSSRSVSGAMRKLVAEGYVTKTPGNPVVYSLTDMGRNMTC